MIQKRARNILIVLFVILISATYFSFTALSIKDSITDEKINSGWVTTINIHLFKIPNFSPQGGSSKPIFSQYRLSSFQGGKYNFFSSSLHIPFNIVTNKIVCVFVPGYKLPDDLNLYNSDIQHSCFTLSPLSIKKTLSLEKEGIEESYSFLNHIWGVPPVGQAMSYQLFDYIDEEYTLLQNLDPAFLEKEENYDSLHSKSYFYFETGVYFNDTSLCEKANFMRNRCYQELAEKRKDPKLCDNLIDIYVMGILIEPSREYCLQRASIIN